MTLLVYVDASFRGRRDMASGIAAMLISDGHVRGRAALAVQTNHSHDAEKMAVVLGIQLAMLVSDAHKAIIHSDSEAVVKMVNKNRIDSITNMIAKARDNGLEIQVVYVERSQLQMTHVDYLSKSITTE